MNGRERAQYPHDPPKHPPTPPEASAAALHQSFSVVVRTALTAQQIKSISAIMMS
jgi:hypothetical protein